MNSYVTNSDKNLQKLIRIKVEEERENSIKALKELARKQPEYSVHDAVEWLEFRRDSALATRKQKEGVE